MTRHAAGAAAGLRHSSGCVLISQIAIFSLLEVWVHEDVLLGR